MVVQIQSRFLLLLLLQLLLLQWLVLPDCHNTDAKEM